MIKRHIQKGNALIEYGMIAGLIAVAGVAFLMMTGFSMNNALQGVKSDFSANVAASNGAGPYSAGGGVGIGGKIPAPGPNQTQVCYEGGWCVNIPMDTASKSATTGTLGDNAYAFSDLFYQVGAQLGAVESVDRSLKRLVTDIAQKGDDLAAIEQMIAENCPKGSFCVMDPYQVSHLQKGLLEFKSLYWEFEREIEEDPDVLPKEVTTMLTSRANEIITVAQDMLGGADKTEAETAAGKTEVKAADICTQGIAGQCDATLATVDAAAQPLEPAATEPVATGSVL